MARRSLRNLVLVLGDQLDHQSSAFDGFDPARDRIWMCEALEESLHVPSSKQRTAVFLAAMRHFAAALRDRAWPLEYRALGEGKDATSLGQALSESLAADKVETVIVVEPGDWRVLQQLRAACEGSGVALDIRPDRHFLCSIEEFKRHASGRKQLRLEYFYRELRRRHQILMEPDSSQSDGWGPAGGQWNFDADNREAFGSDGPGRVRPPRRFSPDAMTAKVLELVRTQFAANPGELEEFGWPVTRDQALEVLKDFIEHRFAQFGRWQDAMWQGEPWLHHSHLAVALNLKLLHPREVIDAAEKAWREGRADLASAEGFIRQILGWREYVRGLYWWKMPEYGSLNALDAQAALPDFFWSGKTEMACLSDAIGQTLKLGYAHHIQRLMVTGLYALLLGVRPKEVHAWYLSVYVDAVEWVELPNVLGMSQYADAGLMASKPYAATGKYIDRMSNYCGHCPYRPGERVGDKACPFTTLYWDFLDRHSKRLAANPRMALQVKNLARISGDEMDRIRARARTLRESGGA